MSNVVLLIDLAPLGAAQTRRISPADLEFESTRLKSVSGLEDRTRVWAPVSGAAHDGNSGFVS
jgi:hypothetical protein